MPQRKLLLSFRNIVKNIIIIFLAVSLLLLILGIIFAPFILKIRNIECFSQYGECPDNITEKLSQYLGKSVSKVKKNIKLTLSNEKSISAFTLRFKLPNTLRIDLLIKKPTTCIKNTDSFLLVSDSGQILSIAPNCTLPTVITSGVNKNVGDTVEQSVLNNLKIIEGIFFLYQVREANLANNSLTVELKPGLVVIFPESPDDPAPLLGALRLIITKIENEGKEVHEIDLRFENPVLR